MSDFKPCVSPACSACQEVRRLRETQVAIEARVETWIEFEYGCTPGDVPHTYDGHACPGCELRECLAP